MTSPGPRHGETSILPVWNGGGTIAEPTNGGFVRHWKGRKRFRNLKLHACARARAGACVRILNTIPTLPSFHIEELSYYISIVLLAFKSGTVLINGSTFGSIDQKRFSADHLLLDRRP